MPWRRQASSSPLQSVADGLHVGAVLVAAHARPHDGLGQVVADVQAEFAPDFLPDVLGGAGVEPGGIQQGGDRLDPFALVGGGQLTEDDADGGLRVEAVAVPSARDAILMRAWSRWDGPTWAAIFSSLSTPFIRLMTVVFSAVTARMVSMAPSRAPYFSATTSRSAPWASGASTRRGGT